MDTDTDEDAQAIGAEAAADSLADVILAGASAPDVRLHVTLRGWIAFARGEWRLYPRLSATWPP